MPLPAFSLLRLMSYRGGNPLLPLLSHHIRTPSLYPHMIIHPPGRSLSPYQHANNFPPPLLLATRGPLTIQSYPVSIRL